jgi:flagellin-like hook-associated protein FlgL
MKVVSISNQFVSLSSQVSKARGDMETSVARLSSGKRITSAADDVAGMSVSTRLSTRLFSLRSAMTNIMQAESLLQVADDALRNSDEMLARMNALSVMARSGSLTSVERHFLNLEFQQLREEIDRTLGAANFNNVPLFSGVDDIVKPPKTPIDDTVYNVTDVVGKATGKVVINTGTEIFDGYVDNDGTHSWLLVGRGREDWEFDADGQGNRDDVITGLGTSAAFQPAAYDPQIINDLLTNAGLSLTDVEIRLKRAANVMGTEYQEVRWRPTSNTQWTWDFDGANMAVEQDVLPSILGGSYSDTTAQTYDSGFGTPVTSAGNTPNRVWTFDWAGKVNIQGFSYGNVVNGVDNNDPNTFLWENTTEAHATPYTEVYIRVKDGVTASAPTAATPQIDSIDSIGSMNGLQLWLDGADLDGDSLAEGLAETGATGGVSAWVDKAGGLNATQASAANRPTYVADGINGNGVLRFDGANDFLSSVINVPETNYTQFVVFKSTDNAGAFTTITDSPSNAAGAHDRQFGLSGAGTLSNRLWNTEIINSGAQTFNNGQAHIAAITVDSVQGQHIDVNARQVATGVKTSSDFNWQTHMVIGGHTFTGQFAGDIGEVINFDRVLTADETAIVEGYLAHKWGTTASLPDDHPYKYTSPFAKNPDDKILSVREDVQTGSILASIRDDYPEGSMFAITAQSHKLFEMHPSKGQLSLAKGAKLDFETVQSHDVTIEITLPDGKGTRTQKILINVQNVNETMLTFAVGANSEDVLEVPISLLNSKVLFDGATPDITTSDHAADASELVLRAIDRITARRAEIGSVQSRASILFAARESEIYNQKDALGVIADTNIASTSTEYSLQQVQSLMSINSLRQTEELRRDSVLGIVDNAIQIEV